MVKEKNFSVVGSALTDSKIPKRYWSDLKRKLSDIEIALADLGEIATRELEPQGLEQNSQTWRKYC